MRNFAWIAAVLSLTIGIAARAETIQWVNSPRIHFGDAVPSASGTLATLDMGSAPPPGSSRLFSKDELRTFAALVHENVDGLDIPNDVRVKRTTRLMSEHDLDALIRPALSALLPPGVSLKGLGLPKTLVTVPNIQVGEIQMPRLPKHLGTTHATPTIELIAAGVLITRLSVSAELQLDERATKFALERGGQLNLVIDTGATRISATAVLMTPADIGDIVPCQVVNTRKILRARITTISEAIVVRP